jgi:hypothetical protein
VSKNGAGLRYYFNHGNCPAGTVAFIDNTFSWVIRPMEGNMQKLLLISAIMLLMLVIGVQSSFAGRHGVYLDLSSGSGDAEWDSDTSSWDIDSDSFAGGYVFDSDPDQNKVFNYRLNLGIVRQEIEDDFDYTMESAGIYAENIFGFAFNKNENFRWWAGPLVRLGFYSGEIKNTNVDVDYAEFGLGLASGMNFMAGNTVISPSLGVRFSGYAGEGEDAGYSEDLEAKTTNAFFNLAVLF